MYKKPFINDKSSMFPNRYNNNPVDYTRSTNISMLYFFVCQNIILTPRNEINNFRDKFLYTYIIYDIKIRRTRVVTIGENSINCSMRFRQRIQYKLYNIKTALTRL